MPLCTHNSLNQTKNCINHADTQFKKNVTYLCVCVFKMNRTRTICSHQIQRDFNVLISVNNKKHDSPAVTACTVPFFMAHTTLKHPW